MANGTLTEEEERLLMERAAARAANPAVNTFADLSASYIPEQYAKPLDVFKEMVSPYNMDYTSPSGTLSFDPSGTTYPQYDDAGNVKVYQGQVFNPPVHGVYHPVNEQFMALDAPTANFFANATPDDIATGQVPTGSRVRTGVLPPAEVIKGSYNTFEPSWLGLDSDLGTVPGIKEIQITPTEIEKVISGQGATAKTIHQRPNEMPEAQKYIDKLNTPLAGTGVETSMLGKYGPALKGAGRFLGLAGYPMSAMAASDYWGAGKPLQAGLAVGSMIPGPLGWASLAGETALNVMERPGVQPEDAADASMGGGGMPGPSMGGHPGMGMAAGYDVSGQTPGLAGTQTGMDVAMDAGGAVPAPTVDYGQMAQDWGDPTMMSTPAAPTGVWDLADPTGGLAATDPNLQGVTPRSMVQVGGIPSGRTFGVPTSADLYSEAGVPMSNENLSWFGAAPVPTSPSMNVDYSAALDQVNQQPSKSIGEMYESTAHNMGTGIMNAFGIDTQQHMDNVGMINKLSQSDMLDVPTGWTNEMYAAGLKAQDFVQAGANPLLAMAGSYPYQAATEAFRATVDPTISYEEAMNMASAQGLGGLIGAAGGLPAFEGPIGELIDDTVEKNVLGITTPDATPNTFSPLASSDITAQATIDEATARQIAQQMALPDEQQRMLASNVPSVPVPAAPVSAPMAPRQQAMPEVSIPEMLAREDVRTAMAVMAPRQDVMPAAPAGPSPAQIAAQVAAAEQSHRDQQASARQALNDFYASREYQNTGTSAPAGLIEEAYGVDSFSVNPFAQGMEAGIGPMGAGSGMGQAGSGGHPGMR